MYQCSTLQAHFCRLRSIIFSSTSSLLLYADFVQCLCLADNHRMRRQLKLQQGTRYIYGPNANSLMQLAEVVGI